MKYYKISEKKLKELVRYSYELSLLEKTGVDNWNGYDEAFENEQDPREYAEEAIEDFEMIGESDE